MGRRQEVLAALRAAAGPQRITDLAAELGIHPNTVRFHLEALLTGGQVEQFEPTERTGPGRPALQFVATRQMDPDGPRSYQILAEALAATIGTGPDPTQKARRAGQAWGRQLGASPATGVTPPTGATPATSEAPATGESSSEGVPELLTTLTDLGFAPERRREGTQDQIRLRHCPFLDLIADHGEVICPLHLGLMEGVLAERGSTVQVRRLEPFAEPDLCLAHLDRT